MKAASSRAIWPTALALVIATTVRSGTQQPPSDPATISMNADANGAIASGANVRYVVDVSGLGEAEALLQAFPKAPDWNQDPPAICRARRESLAASQRSLNEFLSPERQGGGTSHPPLEVMQAHF